MNLDEMEALDKAAGGDGDDEAITCELVVEEDEDTKLEEWCDKIMRHLFGAEGVKLKGKKGVKKILSKALGDVDEIENDLAETLDLLDESLTLLERILAKHAHSVLAVDMVQHMEEVADHLSNWGLHMDPPADIKLMNRK